MLKIDGKELVLNQNKGFIGDLKYEQTFNRSLTDDLMQIIKDGVNVKFDRLGFFRICFLMSGYIDNITFDDFLSKIHPKYNFLEDFIDVLEKAQSNYLPIESPKEESTEQAETK